jgi:hypothetical protein
MKVLFVLDNYIKFYSIDDAVRALHTRGHTILIVMGMKQKENFPDDAIQSARQDLPGLEISSIILRRFWRRTALIVREILNYISILSNEQERAWDALKWQRFLPPLIWRLLNTSYGKSLTRQTSFQTCLRSLERKIPVDGRIKRWLKTQAPDIIILSPLINPASVEADYLQAALALKIPSVYALYSWDNLTSKGTFHRVPDRSLVWSRSLALDLTKWHNIPPHQIMVTGAPRFDPWFEGKLDMGRSQFCQLAGLDPQKPFILYVCSTFLVDSNYNKEVSEATIISEMSHALNQCPETQDIQVLVRPHPTNSRSVIESITTLNDPRIHVYPSRGEFPDTNERRRVLYNSIHHSQAVTGVNTTAFLEAAILDKPCITIMVQRFEQTQMLPHFHHLLDAEFLDAANGAQNVPPILMRLMDGRDERADNRRRFVNEFIRPHGMKKNAADAYADAIEKIFSKEEGLLDNYGL